MTNGIPSALVLLLSILVGLNWVEAIGGYFFCYKTRLKDNLELTELTLDRIEVDYEKVVFCKGHEEMTYTWSFVDIFTGKTVYESEPRTLRFLKKVTSMSFENFMEAGQQYELSLIPDDLCADEVEFLDIVMPDMVRDENVPNLSLDQSLSIIRSSGPINILLLGLPGVGKSSFQNTVDAMFSGVIRSGSDSGPAKGTRTQTVIPHKLPGTKVTIIDTPGYDLNFPLSLLKGIVRGEVGNNVDLRTIGNSDATRNTNPSLDEMVHCVVVVIDAADFAVKSHRSHEWYTRLRDAVESFRKDENFKPVRVVVVYTKIDMLFKRREDWLQIYRQPRAQPLLTAAKMFGVQQYDVFFVKNYWTEHVRDSELEALALEPIAQAVQEGQAFRDEYLGVKTSPVQRVEIVKREEMRSKSDLKVEVDREL